jgi:archaellum component FlaF (FlaF/FlaG flagellin family)
MIKKIALIISIILPCSSYALNLKKNADTEDFYNHIGILERPPQIIKKGSINENISGATVKGLTMPDSDDKKHTLALSGPDANQFEITNGQLRLKTHISANYETKSNYKVTVSATDSGQQSFQQEFKIIVLNVNDRPTIAKDKPKTPTTHTNNSPTAIALDNNTLTENKSGTSVGALTVTDSDDKKHTLALSGPDANQFEITNNQLRLKTHISANYETKSNYKVTVSATDSGQQSFQQEFKIIVLDVSEAQLKWIQKQLTIVIDKPFDNSLELIKKALDFNNIKITDFNHTTGRLTINLNPDILLSDRKHRFLINTINDLRDSMVNESQFHINLSEHNLNTFLQIKLATFDTAKPNLFNFRNLDSVKKALSYRHEQLLIQLLYKTFRNSN